jgi:hypothetical protein
MKIKKTKMLASAVFCASVLAPVFGVGGTALAAGNEYIYFKTRQEGTQDFTTCKFYDNNPNSIYENCNTTYGSYDTTNKKLTLGNGINNLPNGYVMTNVSEGITISASGNIESAIYDYSGQALTLDFGEYSFTDIPYKVSDSQENVSNSNLGHNLTVKSGMFNVASISTGVSGSLKIDGGTTNITESISVGSFRITNGVLNIPGVLNIQTDVEINGGTINITNKPAVALSLFSGVSFSMSSGVINVSGCGIGIVSDDINISGGSINMDEIETSGFSAKGDIKVSGGEINLESTKDKKPAGFGFHLIEGKNLTVESGEITLDGFDWGISLYKAKVHFNGGVTTIKNSKEHSIWITVANNPKEDIAFGDGMGIKEKDTYVFYDDRSTGIAGSGTVTIAEGYTYRRHYGYETIDDESNNTDESDVKVPNTGVFGDNESNAVSVIISLGVVLMLFGGTYVLRYGLERRKNSVKFQKR